MSFTMKRVISSMFNDKKITRKESKRRYVPQGTTMRAWPHCNGPTTAVLASHVGDVFTLYTQHMYHCSHNLRLLARHT